MSWTINITESAENDIKKIASKIDKDLAKNLYLDAKNQQQIHKYKRIEGNSFPFCRLKSFHKQNEYRIISLKIENQKEIWVLKVVKKDDKTYNKRTMNKLRKLGKDIMSATKG